MRRGTHPVSIDFGSAVQFQTGRDDFTDVTTFLMSLGGKFTFLADEVRDMDTYDLEKILGLTKRHIH